MPPSHLTFSKQISNLFFFIKPCIALSVMAEHMAIPMYLHELAPEVFEYVFNEVGFTFVRCFIHQAMTC